MKFKKILLLTLAAPLLASCGGESDKVEEPTFATYSNKVEYKDYAEKLLEKYSASKFSGKDFDSYEASLSTKSRIKSSFDGDSAVDIKNDSVSEIEIQYDSVNGMMGSTTKHNSDFEYTTSYGSQKSTNEEETVKFEQLTDGHKIEIDVTANTYIDHGEKSDYNEELKSDAYSNASNVLTLVNYICSSYALETSDEEKAKYSFYVDESVFTWVYENTEEKEVKDGKDDTLVIGTKTTKTVNKVQLELTDTKLREVSSFTQEAAINYTADGADYSNKIHVKAGNKLTSTSIGYKEGEIEFKEVNLVSKDLTKLTKVGEDD